MSLFVCADLVKFLLDTKNFAVVQDMIGIASELPTISAIVESKSGVPLPTVSTSIFNCFLITVNSCVNKNLIFFYR